MSTKITKPEGWSIIKIEKIGEPTIFKIFGTWRWSEEWALSSGSSKPEEIQENNDYFEWKQNSGSIYQLTSGGENGMTMWQSMKLDIILGHFEKHKGKATIVKIKEALQLKSKTN